MWHTWIGVIARIMTGPLADDLKCVTLVHRGVNLFAVAAQVVVDAAAAEHRAARAEVNRHFGREDADVCGPLDENRIGREKRVVLLDDRTELVEELFALLQPAARQV